MQYKMLQAPSARIDRWFEDYAAYHLHPANRLCHSIGVPLIGISLLGLLSQVSLGLPLWALALVWYLILDWKLALPFGLFALGWYWIGQSLSTPLLGLLFVLGWVFQGVGHQKFEKNRPAFLTNVRHLLIGPFWLFAVWIGYPRVGGRV